MLFTYKHLRIDDAGGKCVEDVASHIMGFQTTRETWIQIVDIKAGNMFETLPPAAPLAAAACASSTL
jgi:hypothetical protein